MGGALGERQDVIDCIYRKAPYLTRSLRRIAEAILEHPDQCKTMTIKDLATASHVAESTMTHFVKEIDLKSYQELKMALVEALTLRRLNLFELGKAVDAIEQAQVIIFI